MLPQTAESEGDVADGRYDVNERVGLITGGQRDRPGLARGSGHGGELGP